MGNASNGFVVCRTGRGDRIDITKAIEDYNHNPTYQTYYTAKFLAILNDKSIPESPEFEPCGNLKTMEWMSIIGGKENSIQVPNQDVDGNDLRKTCHEYITLSVTEYKITMHQGTEVFLSELVKKTWKALECYKDASSFRSFSRMNLNRYMFICEAYMNLLGERYSLLVKAYERATHDSFMLNVSNSTDTVTFSVFHEDVNKHVDFQTTIMDVGTHRNVFIGLAGEKNITIHRDPLESEIVFV